MIHQPDYSALSEPLTKVDIATYKRSSKQATFIRDINLDRIMYMAFMLLVAMGVGSRNLLLLLLLPLIVVVSALFFWWLPFRKKVLYRARLYAFAMHNGVRMIVDDQNPKYAGMIFNTDVRGKITEALQFEGGIEIGNYIFMESRGKDARYDTWAYVKVKLARSLPHMILDAKANNIWKFSNLEWSFDRAQVLQLEGDFNKYFTLYAPKQYERDALYVFTPDVMAVMIDDSQEYDIEIIGDELYMYSLRPFLLDIQETYNALFKVIGAIHNELTDQIEYYADENVGNRKKNAIAPQGQYLKLGLNWPYVILSVIIAGLLLAGLLFPFVQELFGA